MQILDDEVKLQDKWISQILSNSYYEKKSNVSLVFDFR